jgi:VWFA-related protein
MHRTSRFLKVNFHILLACLFARSLLLADGELQLVNLNVIAVDNHGEPVTDLTSADFHVTDGGKPQQIVFFRHYDNKLTTPPTLAPNEVSNRTNANIPRAAIILLDLLNEDFSSRGYSSDQLVRYVID